MIEARDCVKKIRSYKPGIFVDFDIDSQIVFEKLQKEAPSLVRSKSMVFPMPCGSRSAARAETAG
jgi:hypothetical protein